MSEQNNEAVEGEFLAQVGALQGTLSKLATDISDIGEKATQRLDEMESMAAHIMAIESVMAVMLKNHPVEAQDVHDMVVSRTAELSGHEDGSPSVQAVAVDILAT